jgi:hypothetical protein
MADPGRLRGRVPPPPSAAHGETLFGDRSFL